MGQHCSSTMSVWMVAVLTIHGSNIVLLLCQCGWLFFSKMTWFQHCSSIMSVSTVVILTYHGATLFFYYVSVDGCCSNMPWGNIVLLLCQFVWLLF